MSSKPSEPPSLQSQLERLGAAMQPAKPAPVPSKALRPLRTGGMALALALVATAVATGQPWLAVPAAILGILSGALFLGGEVDAIAAALEEVARGDREAPGAAPVVEVGGAAAVRRNRERD